MWKIDQFLSSTKKDAHKRKLVPIFLPHGVYIHLTVHVRNLSEHTHTFSGPLSRTTQLSRYQKGKPNWILLKQETVSSSGISWAVCKSAPCSRQTTMPVPHHSVFYRPDALPAAQPTASKHWRPHNFLKSYLLYNVTALKILMPLLVLLLSVLFLWS